MRNTPMYRSICIFDSLTWGGRWAADVYTFLRWRIKNFVSRRRKTAATVLHCTLLYSTLLYLVRIYEYT